MAISLGKENFGELIDPFNGMQDLSDKILRTPLEPVQTYSDDPLRMMRAIRFASTLNFKIEEKSLKAIKQEAKRIEIVSMERIMTEFNKIMLSEKPSTGLSILEKNRAFLILFFLKLRLLKELKKKKDKPIKTISTIHWKL